MIFQAQIPLSGQRKGGNVRGEGSCSDKHLGQPGHLLLQTQPTGSLSKLNWSWKIQTGSKNFQLFRELNVI